MGVMSTRIVGLIACLPLLACGGSEGDSRGDDSATAPTLPGTVSVSASGTAPTSGMTGDGSATDGPTGGMSMSASMGTTAGVDDSTGPENDSGELPKFDINNLPDIGAGCGGGVMVDESYIWIPSTSDGWVSKINTRTIIEEARYLTGPSGGGESVSRTAVSGDGRFVVVNARGSGRSTAFAASIEDCKDTNGDGMITTSTGVRRHQAVAHRRVHGLDPRPRRRGTAARPTARAASAGPAATGTRPPAPSSTRRSGSATPAATATSSASTA
jgi:hypothetical protein